VLQICGGEVGPVVEQTTASHPTENAPISLRQQRISRLLGIDIEAEKVAAMLQRLGMLVEPTSDGWNVTAPSFRFDINIEADLLEEIVRIYGYNNIPRRTPLYHTTMQPVTELEIPLARIKQTLVDRDYFEAITYSFVDPELQQVFDPDAKTVALANPLSSEMSVMRTTLLPGLVNALRHNLNRQHPRVRLFETGLCFIPQDELRLESLQQIDKISAAVTGSMQSEQWAQPQREVDFFDLKADVEALLAMRGLSCDFVRAEHAVLHPGQSASIHSDGKVIGWLGALHPQVLKAVDIDQPVYVFELELVLLQQARLPAFTPLSKYPEVRRDLAIVVDDTVTVADIESAIQKVASDRLREIKIFDIYTGKGVDSGQKSVAFGLILQEFSRTLTDEDIDHEVGKIVSTLKTEFTATLRE
jgi:phenylalanyl-tRNA synthetase beta chain